MLVRACRLSEPAVVGDEQQKARPVGTGHDLLGKDAFVADQRHSQPDAWDIDRPRCRASGKASAVRRGQPLDAEPPQRIAEGNIFAERHQMPFLVKPAAGADNHGGIEITLLIPAW
jgi:hypothetical protein